MKGNMKRLWGSIWATFDNYVIPSEKGFFTAGRTLSSLPKLTLMYENYFVYSLSPANLPPAMQPKAA